MLLLQSIERKIEPLLIRSEHRLLVLSFLALFLELLVIRWVPAHVRLFAYYANLMLISSFLGLGIGALLSSRPWKLWRWFLPLAGATVGSVIIGRNLAMPITGDEARFFSESSHSLGYILLIAIFVLNTLTFIPIGQQIGGIFQSLPPLRAYAWDLAGSLLGTLVFGAFSIAYFSPQIGFAMVLLLFLLIVPRNSLKSQIALGTLLLAGFMPTDNPRAIWSAYHYLTVHDPFGLTLTEPEINNRTRINPISYVVRVNQDFYQAHSTLDPKRYALEINDREWDVLHAAYLLPYHLRPQPNDVLVLGAGGGMDVEAALLSGANSVDAVEIDRAIVGISRKFNPSGVYDDPRVSVKIDDARAYLGRSTRQYDAVVFGFLDSQNLFSYGSNLRLDGYVYTVEGFRTAFAQVRDGGILSVSFSLPKEWVIEKLVRMLHEATGVVPIIYRYDLEYVLVMPKFQPENIPDKREMFRRIDAAPLLQTRLAVASDDWPYLYLQQHGIPRDYLIVIAILLIVSIASVLALRGGGISVEDGHFFFMGLGFLLLQTKSISDCSLYFGTTWMVGSIVICGTLLMILLANLTAILWVKSFRHWLYMPLFASLLALVLIPRQLILGQEFPIRLAWALLAVPLPIFFAGLIFSTTFRVAANPAAVFGANLIGATMGGFCEYLGMWVGSAALSWIVIGAYLLSLIFLMINRRRVQII